MLPNYFSSAVSGLDVKTPVVSSENHDEMKDLLEGTLAAFKVKGHVANVERGPSISRFSISLQRGVSVKTVTRLQDDIQCSLSAVAVRVEAPIPGTNLVGIEIPNKVRERVYLNEFDMDSADLSPLSFPLGKGISGQEEWADLAKLPHLLVAGATNSGKSVFLNSLISTLVLRNNPEELKLILIDPKRVELSIFAGIPHLLTPPVTEPENAIRVLRKACSEMDNRYKTLQVSGVRNIASYNESAAEKMPYIVIVVDELADLMMTSGYEVETLLCRLSQMARAVGIHLVLATQRPSVDVLTGLIKANVPARLAFSLPSQVDSKIILDKSGAEDLTGQGDMLFNSPTQSTLVRAQGVYLTEGEVTSIVAALRATRPAAALVEDWNPRQNFPSLAAA